MTQDLRTAFRLAAWAAFVAGLVVVLATSAECVPAQPPAAAAPETPFDLIRFDRQGNLRDPDRLEEIKKRFRGKAPTHIFLLAHGWNNSEDAARASYRKMLQVMRDLAVKEHLRPAGFRAAIIGLHWPSLAFEENKELTELILSQIPASAARAIQPVLKLKYEVNDLQEFFARKWPAQIVAKAFSFIRPFLGKEFAAPEGGDTLNLAALAEKDMATLIDATRIFTFWHMKKRAGTVGANGVRRLLLELQVAFPQAQCHLFGHSFGCKLWLAALAGEEPLPRPVDTLVLLQGAVSTQAFAQTIAVGDKVHKAAYHHVVAQRRVKGPIVATFTAQDLPVMLTYPLAARAAGQVGELDVGARTLSNKAYHGMGAWGIEGVKARAIRKVGESYGFKDELHAIDGTDTEAITGHSGFYTPEVAWMIWAAVMRK
jgi:hypothetical protein